MPTSAKVVHMSISNGQRMLTVKFGLIWSEKKVQGGNCSLKNFQGGLALLGKLPGGNWHLTHFFYTFTCITHIKCSLKCVISMAKKNCVNKVNRTTARSQITLTQENVIQMIIERWHHGQTISISQMTLFFLQVYILSPIHNIKAQNLNDFDRKYKNSFHIFFLLFNVFLLLCPNSLSYLFIVM